MVEETKCLSCSNVIPNEAVYCPYCGKKVEHIIDKNQIQCQYCKRGIPKDAIVCPYCSNKVEREKAQGKCPNCGKIIPEDARICPYCKKDFEQEIPKRTPINSGIIEGIIAFIMILIDLDSIAYIIFSIAMQDRKSFNSIYSIGAVIIPLGCIYFIYRTLYKKQRLSDWEWIGFSFLLAWFLVNLFYGFMLGYIGMP